MLSSRRWDVFCRVIDNHGDLGVCWRLAADLASRGERVRLWADDLSALSWMAPHGAPGVETLPWADAEAEASPTPGDVVIEAFGCDPPPTFVARMARQPLPPVWINLEYLSAEKWVERCHGLPSPPGVGPGRGLVKWFFYPGFTASTGGLIREPGLASRRERFDATTWAAARGLQRRDGERRVVLFCYDNAHLPSLLDALAEHPTLLVLTPGHAQRQVHALPPRPGIRTVDVQWLSQKEFDHLLWSADLNIVRGEDSLVRALWAGVPFLWQLYPQHDGAHRAKMEAFLTQWKALAGVEDSGLDRLEPALSVLWTAWNFGTDSTGARMVLPDVAAWREAARRACRALWEQPDLTTRLLEFVQLQSRVCSVGSDPPMKP